MLENGQKLRCLRKEKEKTSLRCDRGFKVMPGKSRTCLVWMKLGVTEKQARVEVRGEGAGYRTVDEQP